MIISGIESSSPNFSSRSSTTRTPGSSVDRPVVFAIITSSPLWCTYKNGKVDDFFVGESHLLVQLTPQARMLKHTKTKAKYTDVVDIAQTGQLIFGRTPSSSGLTLDFETGVAILSSSDAESGEYMEIPVRGEEASSRTLHRARTWKTTARMDSVEVYTLARGVADDLVEPRSEE